MTNIEQWPISRPIPYARNARKIPQSAIDKVATSIAEFGWQQPIVVDRNGVIVAGHTRLLAAQKLCLEAVPVHVAADLTEGQTRAYRLMDNRSSAEAGWDLDLIAVELCDLQALAVDLSLTGFDAVELKDLMGADPTAEGAADEVTEPPAQPVTEPGDIWLIGPHRLICGDCRDSGVIHALFGDAKANVVVTSPPYATQRDYDSSSGFKPVRPDEYVAWFCAVAAGVESILAPDGSYLLNIKEHSEEGERSLYVKDLVTAHKRQWGWRLVDEFCWRNTANGVPGKWPNRLKNAWEPVFHFCRNKEIKFRPKAAGHKSDDVVVYSPDNPSAPSGSGLLGCGADKIAGIAWPSNVIEAKAEGGQGSHSAPFPRALVEFFVLAFSDAGDVICDPFMGSGTTMAAATALDRTGYGCEISPAYCDVILRRIVTMTEKDAILASTGESFASVAKERGVPADHLQRRAS